MTVNVKPPAADLRTLALAAVSQALPEARASLSSPWTPAMLPACVAVLRSDPGPADRALAALAEALGLSDAELMAVALCAACDLDPKAARAVAAAQAPIGGSRPLVGLAATAFAPLGATPLGLVSGAAAANGLLELDEALVALPERSLSVPLPILAACYGRPGAWPGVAPVPEAALPLPESLRAEAAERGRTLAPGHGLALRTASLSEGLAVAALAAAAVGLRLALVEPEPPKGLAPWLIAAGYAPVFTSKLGPGDTWRRPRLGDYRGPWFVVSGFEGGLEAEPAPEVWTLATPAAAERAALWRAGGMPEAVAAQAAEAFRQGAARIDEAAARARAAASRRGDPTPGWSDLAAAVAEGTGPMGGLARRSAGNVNDDALVLPAGLRAALDRLLDRARVRDRLQQGLGPAVTARYRPGVRALFHGESGSGKTLAAHWLAGRLGLPLYRVDLAAITSKWIGETEKHLSEILSAAEHADVLLFFDEADALFAARTDVSDANDRHANAQTNYLLQRIEEFDGVALLASNSRDRFDPAFVRRLDAILEFPAPDAAARRELWTAHLGGGHALSTVQLDRLAVALDLTGGHIRNVVLAAAAQATAHGRGLGWRELAEAAQEEYAKLGRPPPELPL